MKRIFIAAVLAVIISVSAAESITLEQAIRLGLENNLSLQSSSENVAIADGFYREVKSSLLPQVQLIGAYQLSRTELPSAWIPDRLDVTDMLSATADDDAKLLAGVLEQGFNSMLPEATQDETNFVAGIKLDQVVYLGGKLMAGIRAADRYKQLERMRYELAEQDIVFRTIEMFYQGLLLEDVVKINKQALELAEQHFTRVQRMYQQGLVSEFDTIRAELELMKLQPMQKEAENNYRLWLEAFRKHLGIKEQSVSLQGKIEMPEDFSPPAEEAVSYGKEHRLELRLLGTIKEMYEIQYSAEKGNYLPNVALSAEYNTFSRKNKFDVTPDKFGSSYQVMLGLQMPIFTGFRNRAKIAQARHEYRKATLDYLDLFDKIELDIRNAGQQLTYALTTYETQQKRVQLAEKGLTIANARYESQVGINLEVLDAQMEFSLARLSYLQAVYEITIAQKSLRKAMGMELF